MDFDKVLHIATFAGRIILESGGETYRVEETICRICAAYGIRLLKVLLPQLELWFLFTMRIIIQLL